MRIGRDLIILAALVWSNAPHAAEVLTPEECQAKYWALIKDETNQEKVWKLDAAATACKKRGAAAKTRVLYLGDATSGGKAKDFPAAGSNVAQYLRDQDLVVTRSESACSGGTCQVTAYLTRESFKKHRPGDTGAFCGAMATWTTSERGAKRWSPSNGLAKSIADGNDALVLASIDGKDGSYCR